MKHDIRIDSINKNTVLGFANSSESCFEQISLHVTAERITCQSSTCIPTKHAEDYIELYHKVLEVAKELQEEIKNGHR